MFTLVRFTEEGDCYDIVPSKWVQGSETYWPNLKGPFLRNAVKLQIQPMPEWETYPVFILGKAETLEEAEPMLARIIDGEGSFLFSDHNKSNSLLPSHSREMSAAEIQATSTPKAFGGLRFESTMNANQVCSTLLVEFRRTSTKMSLTLDIIQERLAKLEVSTSTTAANVSELQRYICQKKSDVQEVGGRSTWPVWFPLQNKDDWEKMEEQLLHADCRSEVARVVQSVTAPVASRRLRRILSCLIADNLALCITWSGTPQKPSFKLSRLFGCMQDGLKTKTGEESIPLAEVKTVCIDWFHDARDRCGQRVKKRKDTAKETMANDENRPPL
jgi:hypothetical protein